MRRSFQETAPRKTAENTVKHCNGDVGSMVENHCDGGESSVVIRTLVANVQRREQIMPTAAAAAATSYHDSNEKDRKSLCNSSN